ncbi:LytR family transcriptional attenuator [Brevibacterium sanguinis]|uniref:LytR family transcriptional attenuator n=3 Tax=Brevibacteriaceae TaxID=85019 RepID=A0A366IF82_9MICO|nr:LytR family transcriptional attenuator [Brevibacterium sanguinis]RBP69160.1 LytR family transcriptional attenuator [Brevibacterium celere]
MLRAAAAAAALNDSTPETSTPDSRTPQSPTIKAPAASTPRTAAPAAAGHPETPGADRPDTPAYRPVFSRAESQRPASDHPTPRSTARSATAEEGAPTRRSAGTAAGTGPGSADPAGAGSTPAGSAAAGASAAGASTAAGTSAAAEDTDATDTSRPRDREHSASAIRAQRHASRTGETFPSLVGWTSLSALLPGIGLLRTRFHRLGWILLLGFILTVVAVVGYLLIRGPVQAIGTVVSNPTLLNVIALGAGLVGLIWIAVMVVSHLGLRKGNRYARWQNRLAGLLVVSLALIIGIPFGVGSVFARVQSDTVSSLFGSSTGSVKDAKDLWADKPHINVFLMGRDTGEGREGTRPDTMLVASIDTRTGNAALVSVPRNLAFPIFPEGTPLAEQWPDGFRPTGDSSVDLINSVWDWAEHNPDAVGDTKGLDPGMYASMQAVQGSLGLNIDYWASVDMAGFEDVVDAIGGVKIDVERPIPMGGGKSINGVPNKVNGWIDPGPQTLKGKKALWYVRSRQGADNYDRMCRQQRMLKTTIEQIDPQELAIAYPKLANSATRNIATSIPQNEIPAFIELAVALQKGEVTSVQINNNVTPTYNPDFDELHSWIQDQLKDAADGTETTAPSPGVSDNAPAEGATEAPATTEEQTAEESATEEQAAEAPADSQTAAPGGENEDESTAKNPGQANAEGKCLPDGYEPGDPFPGYPGPGSGDEG